MTSAISVERSDFDSGGDRCAAWLTLPPGPGPYPAVVLVHGLGATRDMMLPQYEQHFATAGIATLSFDYRFTGASGGEPRQHISIPEQCRDVAAAIDVLRRHRHVDAGRIGLWGTSLGGMNVIRVAATRNDIAAAVVQCPITHGPAAAGAVGIRGALRLTPAIVEDAVRAVFRRRRRYVPIVGQPGTDALVTVAGAEDGWRSTVPAGAAFDNRITAVDAALLITRSALRHAARVQAPLLVCVCDQETLMDPRYAEAVAEQAPRGLAKHYESDHFAIYHPPLLPRVLHDQVAFLTKHL
ncbi:alpha/beta hydrolase [Mycolicibacterium aubagnense]|uniref:Alpha/beta hydrolase n=1 Tax=Mycolicibacterium aubagnense TaxID=319707 RepID=A0ABM7IIU4_9MYCO|nr:alpha/beta hydrolase [Mycolicibacterium aubagnense]TLH67353.1 alpha/beta hydrolase [Mycolicibacterium aubagnense]WGI31790.1 alpha/beta fold hydrolase [Mycolicibacterium aubagnense]BBX86716.1 alpha/beta hydrolase [Mycolicibacterium aubagnense]